MPRRFFITQLNVGIVRLDKDQSHHLRDVLRLENGATIGVFDSGGHSSAAIVQDVSEERVSLRIEQIIAPHIESAIVIASAVPKGERADWMIEKLSELGISRFVPLITARSVVLPGAGKLTRWQRIATESAKQSQRVGVMQIDPPIGLDELLQTTSNALYGSTEVNGAPLASLLDRFQNQAVTILIGPEGGWTDEEQCAFERSKIAPFQLTDTILRIETAAIVAAAIASLHH